MNTKIYMSAWSLKLNTIDRRYTSIHLYIQSLPVKCNTLKLIISELAEHKIAVYFANRF